MLNWVKGRGNTGYFKVLIMQSWIPIPFDIYILKFPKGSYIEPHKDPMDSGRHFRLNIIWNSKSGGEFKCDNNIIDWKFLKLFRSDRDLHSVCEIKEGTRYVLSVGCIF